MSLSEWRNYCPTGICAGTPVFKMILETGEENELDEFAN